MRVTLRNVCCFCACSKYLSALASAGRTSRHLLLLTHYVARAFVTAMVAPLAALGANAPLTGIDGCVVRGNTEGVDREEQAQKVT